MTQSDFFQPIDPSVLEGPRFEGIKVNEHAQIHPKAIIGDGTTIWAYSQVDRATLGENCVVGTHVIVSDGVEVGTGTKIQSHAGLAPGTTVGRCVFWGPGTVSTNDLYPRADNPDWVLRKVRVEDGASIGARVVLVCGKEELVIGRRATIGSGSIVTRSVLPHSLSFGSPARHRGWVDNLGRPIESAWPNMVPAELKETFQEEGILDAVRQELERLSSRQ